MEKFKQIKSKAITVSTENIDTDQIIPARFLKTTKKTGLGKYMFYNWRYRDDGKSKHSTFDDVYNRKSEILITGNNFGIGSSREHAVWALLDYGIKVVISSDFGDIFYNNSLKNGLLCIKIKDSQLKNLFKFIAKNPKTLIEINVENQKIEIPKENLSLKFEIDTFRKTCLIMGVDELGYILSHEDKISDYEKRISNF